MTFIPSHLLLVNLLFICSLFSGCKNDRGRLDKLKYGNCTDGIQNQNETNTDCVGVCESCGTCYDGIKNDRETGIDCGGPNCQSCEPPCTIPLSTIIYTVTTKNGLAYESNQAWSGAATYHKTDGRLSIFSFPVTSTSYWFECSIFFRPGFDLFSFVKPGETAIFKTKVLPISASSKNLNVIINYYCLGETHTVDANQSIYISRPGTSDSLLVRACWLNGNNKKDRLLLNGLGREL